MTYEDLFRELIGTREAPHSWQTALSASDECVNRLIRVPTGFGKTLGVFSSWLWRRVVRGEDQWPRRLVWCLPMRVLVEQTLAEVRGGLDRLGLLWDESGDHHGRVGVHALMGGANSGDWHLYPEHYSVLVGTQDMLLSRALNRGYGAARARWPIDFGLLNADALWVMDEVQLMDVGLATSGQLQAFRNEDAREGRSRRPCFTWWMSATLQRSWLEKSPETAPFSSALPDLSIPAEARHGHLWDDVHKSLVIEKVRPAESARLALDAHVAAGRGERGPTLVVLNRVDDAVAVHDALRKDKNIGGTDLRLVHSRFRAHERASWRESFLNRGASGPGVDRIIVSTQVIEAGVDLSSGVLVTAIAPFPSLVQRFGRAARWGGRSEIIVVDGEPANDKDAAPYAKDEIDAAREALEQLTDVSPAQLEAFEARAGDLIERLYPYEPAYFLIRREVEELFDITPDLSGADIDISRFIRSGEERDLQVFWEDLSAGEQPDRRLRAAREALCAVPFLRAREWLCGKETAGSKAPRLSKGMRAWVWDWLDGEWRVAQRRDLYPGQTVLVDARCGGYDAVSGWSPLAKQEVTVVPRPAVEREDLADSCQDSEALSEYGWQTIATHGLNVGVLAESIAKVVDPDRAPILGIAGRWHDGGKAHQVFQASIEGSDRPARRDLAKAPKSAWLSLPRLYPDPKHGRRAGFRHELASTLMLFSVLQRHDPDHPGLLGPWRELLAAAGLPIEACRRDSHEATEIEREILSLTADDFDLVAYLVCSHHGKTRVAWHATPSDQDAADDRLRIRGIRDGETLPGVALCTRSGVAQELPAIELRLAAGELGLNPWTGRGWTARVLSLLDRHGPFTLAWLESILRAADCRASREITSDPLLVESQVSA